MISVPLPKQKNRVKTTYLLVLLFALATLAGLGLLASHGKNLARQDEPPAEGAILGAFDLKYSVFSPLFKYKATELRTQISSGTAMYSDFPKPSNEDSTSSVWDFGYRALWKLEDLDPSLSEGLEHGAGVGTSSADVFDDNHYRGYRVFRPSADEGKTATRLEDLITSGVAELLGSLLEAENRRISGWDTSYPANPFGEALKEAEKDVAASQADDATRTPEDKSQKTKIEKAGEETNDSLEKLAAGSDNMSDSRFTFLFVGNFSDESEVVALPAAQISPAQLREKASIFELAGLGEQSFNLSIVMRGQDSQESVAFGDLNGDAIPDLVITSKATNKAHMYLATGDGRYTFFTDLYGGWGTSTATISDFNNDGSMDVAVAYMTDKKILIDGKNLRKFIFFPTSSTHEEPYSLLPYDFNGDALKDLLIMNYRSFKASAYINQGSAKFVLSHTTDLSALPFFQEKLDLNGDSFIDIVFVERLDNHVSLVMRDGRTGNIASLGNFVTSPSYCFVLGDFNQDGIADVALASIRQ